MYPLERQIRAVRGTSTPLLAIQTPDCQATEQALLPVLTARGEIPLLHWDCVSGVRGMNDAGKAACGNLSCSQSEYSSTDPKSVLAELPTLPQDSVVIMHHLPRLFEELPIIQGIANLREPFKVKGCTVIMLGALVKLPAELQHDLVVLDEPLPTREQLAVIVGKCYQDAELVEPDADTLSKAVDAVAGLSAFSAEQETMMALRRDGLDLDALWERKRSKIEQARGLSVWRGGETMADVAGYEAVVEQLSREMASRTKPNAIVFVDEIEKAMAGIAGDLSGIAQDALGGLLAYLQDHQAKGMIFLGPPGSGKSLTAKAAGSLGGIPTICLDLGAMKGSLVGESETNLRNALKVITAVSDGQTLWIATSNNIAQLPPELKRRFRRGTYFFDLPDEQERLHIWALYRRKFALADADFAYPDDTGWTGAEIAQCCEMAWDLNISVQEAAKRIVPVSISARDQIKRLRDESSGRYLSASTGLLYLPENQPTETKRRLSWDD